MQILRKRYWDTIDSIFSQFTRIMQELLVQAEEESTTIETNLSNEFNTKYSSLKSEFDTFIASTGSNLTQFDEHQSSELSLLKSEALSILSSFSDAQKDLDSHCLAAKEHLKSSVAELDIQFQQQALAHDEEAQRRIDDLKASNLARLAQLQQEHARDLTVLMSDRSTSILAAKVREEAANLLSQVHSMANSIETQRSSVSNALNDAITRTKNAREYMITILKETSDFQAKSVLELEELQAELKLLNENNVQALASLRRLHVEEVAKQRDAVQQKIDEYKRLVDTNTGDVESKNRELRTMFGRNETDVEEITRRHKEEIEAIARKHEFEVKQASKLEEQLHKDLMNLQENLMKIKEGFRRELQEASLESEKKFEAQEIMNNEDMENERERNKNEILEMEREIAKSRVCGSENESTLKATIEKLEKERELLRDVHMKRVREFEMEHEIRVRDLERECQKNIEDFEEKQRNELAEIEKTNENDVKLLEETLLEEFGRVQEGLGSSNNEQLSMLQSKLKDNSEKDRVVLTFTIEYNKALETLSHVPLPSSDPNRILMEMDSEIDTLEKELESMQVSFGRQKISLVENWEKQIKTEGEPRPQSCDDEMDWNQLAKMKEEIETLRQSTKDKEIELQKMLCKLQEDHAYSMKALNNILALATDQGEITEKEKALQDLLSESVDGKKVQKERDLEMLEALRQKIAHEETGHKSRIAELEQSKKKSIEEFCSKREQIQMMIEKSLTKGTTNVAESNSDYEIGRYNATQKFKEQMLALKEELELLEQRRASQAKSFDERLTSLTDNFNYEVKTLKQVQGQEMKKYKTQQQELIKFYDERIGILEENRDKFRRSYEMMPSRESDLEEMRRLDSEARLRLDLVQKAVKDLTEYRWMLTARERDYSNRFGRGPAVGIYDMKSPRTPR